MTIMLSDRHTSPPRRCQDGIDEAAFHTPMYDDMTFQLSTW